ncbi:MAG: PqqD family protein [Candidatus Cryptobacteroides sp.]|nr:PqqD family protein [Bacteroidales bacterium]
MRLDNSLRLRKMGRRYMIVRDDGDNVNMTDVFTLNDTAAALWQEFSGKEFSAEDMCSYLVDNYEVDAEVALRDVNALIEEWRRFGLL